MTRKYPRKSTARPQTPAAGSQQKSLRRQTPMDEEGSQQRSQKSSRRQTPIDEEGSQQRSQSQAPADEEENQQRAQSQTPDQTLVEKVQQITSTSLRISESSQSTPGQSKSLISRFKLVLDGSQETSSISDITQSSFQTVSEVSEEQDSEIHLSSMSNIPNIQGIRDRYGTIRLPSKFQNIDKRERKEEREVTTITSLRHDDGIDILL